MSSRRFGTFGAVPREDARCMWCGALERHRLVWLFFAKKTDLFDGSRKRMLHIAPEEWFVDQLRRRVGGGYLTADLVNPDVMVRMDVTRIPFPPETFDVIYCSHVFEHIPDDRKAMEELRSVLKTGGWAVLLVPVHGETTLEDPSVAAPAERLRLFGQEDHVRRYGADYTDRLREAGFRVSVISPPDFLESAEIGAMGITAAGGDIYRCTK